jgi:hypothetical protein
VASYRKWAFLGLLSVALMSADRAGAHPGGLDRQGCHTNRKTGDYHCHRPPSARPSDASDESESGGVYYPNCAAVRAAGKAPLKRGQPGYAAHLDRDGDGVACE